MILILFSAVPGGILILSCAYMCGCSRFIHVLMMDTCGYGAVGLCHGHWERSHWDPPPRRLSSKPSKDEQELVLVENNVS
ncbi:Uncharacterized protein FKW44_003903 [Caligus rogercresseyi]|uniref:Uncharacterized protein n=1 Tax=Caligus rogercresseyi TaxID=217165 RepID=A0A7T8KM95_CALRO|nr:Uncharacterized protein FKW44_003903 [Caligus rogercresseyi]